MKTKEVTQSVLKILNEADKAYVRLIREYSTLEHTPEVKDKARKFVADIKSLAFDEVNKLIDTEKTALANAAKVKPPVTRDTAAEIRRNSELALMKSAIDGADRKQLIELAGKYGNTEYADDFRTMIQPKIRTLLDEVGPNRMKNQELVNDIMLTLDKLPEEVDSQITELGGLIEDVRSMLYFNNRNFNMAVQATEDGRIYHGNCNARSIENDINGAYDGFNPLGEQFEPLVTYENFGTSRFKTIKLQFNWDEN